MPTPSCHISLTRSPLPAKAEDLACMRIAPEPCCTASANVFMPRCMSVTTPAIPDAHPRREGDYRSSRTGRTRARTSGSTADGTGSRRLFLSTISSCTPAVSCSATVAVVGTAGGDPSDSVTGMNAGSASVSKAPSRYCRCHIVSRERDTPMPAGRRRHLTMSQKALLHDPILGGIAPVSPARDVRSRKKLYLGSELMVGHKVGLIISIEIPSDGSRRRFS